MVASLISCADQSSKQLLRAASPQSLHPRPGKDQRIAGIATETQQKPALVAHCVPLVYPSPLGGGGRGRLAIRVRSIALHPSDESTIPVQHPAPRAPFLGAAAGLRSPLRSRPAADPAPAGTAQNGGAPGAHTITPQRRALLDTIRYAEGTWKGGSPEGYRVL